MENSSSPECERTEICQQVMYLGFLDALDHISHRGHPGDRNILAPSSLLFLGLLPSVLLGLPPRERREGRQVDLGRGRRLGRLLLLVVPRLLGCPTAATSSAATDPTAATTITGGRGGGCVAATTVAVVAAIRDATTCAGTPSVGGTVGFIVSPPSSSEVTVGWVTT